MELKLIIKSALTIFSASIFLIVIISYIIFKIKERTRVKFAAEELNKNANTKFLTEKVKYLILTFLLGLNFFLFFNYN